MLQIYMYFVICFLIITFSAQANNIRLQLVGLSEDLQKNVMARLSTIETSEITSESRLIMRVRKAIEEGLYAMGYYEPRIDFENRPSYIHGRKSMLIVKVFPGEPIRISENTIILRGDAYNDFDYQRFVKEGSPKSGTILNHGKYENFKSGLASLALRKGYFDGEFKKSYLGISVEHHKAFWVLDYDSGKRYHFGKIVFEGSQIRDEYLQKLAPFKNGDYYSSRDLAELSRRLSETGWFNSVFLVPELNKTTPDKTISLKCVLSKRTKNFIETGVGYATDVGPRLQAIWRKPWINSLGQSLFASAYVSSPEQKLSFSYRVPLLENPLGQYYLLQVGAKRTNLNDIKADSSTLTLSRHADTSSGWEKAINLRWSLSHFTQTSITNTTMLLYPGISFNRTRSRGGLMPIWGDSQRYSVDISDTIWGSDVDFFVLQARNTWIRTMTIDQNRFVVKTNFGWIETNNFKKVPPDLRFFAGGNYSIRGYKYKSISARDDNGKLIGALKLATGSFEYQYNVTNKWWGAVFVDSGEAINDIKKNNFETAAGIGIRWQSPVGPIRFDVARPIGNKEEHRLQFYIGLGPEL